MQDASVLAYLFEYEYSIEMRTLHDIFRIFLVATKSQKEKWFAYPNFDDKANRNFDCILAFYNVLLSQ